MEYRTPHMRAVHQSVSRKEDPAAEALGFTQDVRTGEDRRSVLTVLPMTEADVKQVHAIETDSFPSPWPRRAFLLALKSTDTLFLTARKDGKVIGYAGIRLGDCAHILNIAVHRDHRRRKVGSRLLSSLLDLAGAHGAYRVTLEVRASNRPAKRLYGRFGFAPSAIRRAYYVRENEDAIIMERRVRAG
jgi:ribosomal-protein-alanine N-acetyltransferase